MFIRCSGNLSEPLLSLQCLHQLFSLLCTVSNRVSSLADKCNRRPCKNHAFCTRTTVAPFYTCACKVGYTGQTCASGEWREETTSAAGRTIYLSSLGLGLMDRRITRGFPLFRRSLPPISTTFSYFSSEVYF